MKWKNWPVLLAGILLVLGIYTLASKLSENHSLNTYLLDVCGAMTTVILSIATYDEWERRKQRQRYLPPERMGARRVQEEVYQLIYQYAFVLTLRFDKNSAAMRTIQKATISKAEFSKPEIELKAKSAKHISQQDKSIKRDLLNLSTQALKKPQIKKQTYNDANQLILQTERCIRQVDLAIATYGYSFTPEVHKWALDVREGLSQAITGSIPVLSIRLAAASSEANKKLKPSLEDGVKGIVDELIAVGRKTKKAPLEE